MQESATLAMSPAGHIYMAEANSALKVLNASVAKAFAVSQEVGLLALAAENDTKTWPKELSFWRTFVNGYLHEICQSASPYATQIEPLLPPQQQELESLVMSLPPMPGAEYCSVTVLEKIWKNIDSHVRSIVSKQPKGLAGFLTKHLPLWQEVGQVCFHLAENKNDPAHPFAFLTTYASSVGENSRTQYLPLKNALQEYAGDGNKKALLQLLKPVYAASQKSSWVSELLESRDIYHPLAWSPQQAYRLLKDAPELEDCGIVVRLPNWWKKRPRPRVEVSIGNTNTSNFGTDTLLDFDVNVSLQGAHLTKEELNSLLNEKESLVFIRGQWVELDREKLSEALMHWKSVQQGAKDGGFTFIEGMRLLAGASEDLTSVNDVDENGGSWAFVNAGSWLNETLQALRQPASLTHLNPGKSLNAKLRGYQSIGVNWLHFLSELGLGACLADDMGLGKTIQIISLMLVKKKSSKKEKYPSLLILPASLLSNWKDELSKFAPSLETVFLHPAEMSRTELELFATNRHEKLMDVDMVFTTYSMLLRQPWLQDVQWDLTILDEAQAIKNPSARQTKAVKSLKSRSRIALTGTPVENRLGDLWSLFDFLSPGLLGSITQFKSFIKTLSAQENSDFSSLRKLVQPYILRRMKTDSKIISDLPDKSEVIAWCGLSKSQAKLYLQSVNELKSALENESGIKKRGLVLSFLMRFKQICNHPSQVLSDGNFKPADSGKFIRLKEITEEIAMRQEKVLIFTQFREMTEPLSKFLSDIFQRPGLVLHGGTPVKKRQKLVTQFQEEAGPPFFVLSLKAAGVGLNLTAANHVIHFDRWWNPAVENQATDRAFRIGQHRNVLVHKFVCRGTIEEKVDKMINEKTQLADELLSPGGESMLTELDDDTLLDLVSLNLDKSEC